MNNLTVRSVEATMVVVPMKRPLGTSAMQITQAPLLLIDLLTEEGITGRAYLFCYVPAAGEAALALIRDASSVLATGSAAPAFVKQRLDARFRLLGVRGLTAMVMAGIDVACWDALAIAAGQPLAFLLGAPLRALPAYNSNGLGLVDAEQAADEALALVDEGFEAVKMRLGRPDPRQDLEAVRAVRAKLPSNIALMSDFNQALSSNDARERCRLLDGEGLYWIEEPVAHDDYTMTSELASILNTPVQIGENFQGPRAMAQALAARASDLVMPDLERIGGVTGWIAAAALADANRIGMSSHLFHEVSAHLMAATPTAHWLEYVDWADPILQEPLRPNGGAIVPPQRPGHGMVWDSEAVKRYARASTYGGT